MSVLPARPCLTELSQALRSLCAVVTVSGCRAQGGAAGAPSGATGSARPAMHRRNHIRQAAPGLQCTDATTLDKQRRACNAQTQPH